MKTTIAYELKRHTKTSGARVIYACESGSRAWGFASPDSDFDVRYLYVYPEETYTSLDVLKETLDTKPYLHEGTGAMLDFGGWELRKALRLFLKSNGALLEWLHSPLTYHESTPILDLWRSLVPDILDPRALASHYLGMARNSLARLDISAGGGVRAKTYLYAVRPVLAAEWVLTHRTPAPVALADLRAGLSLPKDAAADLDELLTRKATHNEDFSTPRFPNLDRYLTAKLTSLSETRNALPAFEPDRKLVNAFFREVISEAA